MDYQGLLVWQLAMDLCEASPYARWAQTIPRSRARLVIRSWNAASHGTPSRLLAPARRVRVGQRSKALSRRLLGIRVATL